MIYGAEYCIATVALAEIDVGAPFISCPVFAAIVSVGTAKLHEIISFCPSTGCSGVVIVAEVTEPPVGLINNRCV